MSIGDDSLNFEAGPWHLSWIAAFPAGVVVSKPEETSLALEYGFVQFRVKGLDPSLCHLLCRLEAPGISIGELIRAADRLRVSNAVSSVLHHLANLLAEGFLSLSVRDRGEVAATLTAIASGFRLPTRPRNFEKWILSRFATLRRGSSGMAAESPRCTAQVMLWNSLASSGVQSFVVPQTVESAAGAVPGLSLEAASALVDLLHAAELLTAVDDAGRPAEDSDLDLLCWEPHDLLFHSRSRRIRFDAPYGGAFAVADRVPLPPAVKSPRGAVVPLQRPDLETIKSRDAGLTEVLERRRSIREFGGVPLGADQLGEFLFRVARIRGRQRIKMETMHGSVSMETTSRPYPAGGALHELEIYPIIQKCQGLAAGLYRYEPATHGLEVVAAPSAGTWGLLHDAGQSAGVSADDIQLLLIIAARFPRIASKYSAFAYSLVLKHVGVLFQTMYLVATAMNLAPCALGAGNADRFAKLISDSPCAEASVGEFLLGSIP